MVFLLILYRRRPALTYRERVLRTLRFQKPDRIPDWEFGAWSQTIDRWKQEGMDSQGNDAFGTLERYFHTDDALYGGPSPWIHCGLLPAFEWKVLEDRPNTRIIQDGDGAISEQIKVGASIPRYIKFALQTRAGWEKLRDERLDPNTPGRLPADLTELAEKATHADYPTGIWCGSLYGWIRNWMGVEGVSIALYDDPAWVNEMMEHLTQLTLTLLGRLPRTFTIDIGGWWEDMCFNKGPLISPRLFEKLMVPRYKRITDFLRGNFGCQFNCLDCDGNIHELVGPWLRGGINVMFPIEVAHTDHLVPPDVSFDSYVHYRRTKCEILGKEWIEPGPQK